MNKIYFTADLHFGHSNILKHSPKRPFSDTVDIVAHDEWLLDLWKSTVDKRGSIRAYKNYFKEVYQIKEMRFKPSVAPFLKEDLCVVMCHYPMVTWNQKPRGSIMLHGHSHGKLDDYNALSMDLRFDVGIDGSLANLHFLTLEDIYNVAIEKIKQYDCNTFMEYAQNNYRSEVR